MNKLTSVAESSGIVRFLRGEFVSSSAGPTSCLANWNRSTGADRYELARNSVEIYDGPNTTYWYKRRLRRDLQGSRLQRCRLLGLVGRGVAVAAESNQQRR